MASEVLLRLARVIILLVVVPTVLLLRHLMPRILCASHIVVGILQGIVNRWHDVVASVVRRSLVLVRLPSVVVDDVALLQIRLRMLVDHLDISEVLVRHSVILLRLLPSRRMILIVMIVLVYAGVRHLVAVPVRAAGKAKEGVLAS